MRKYRLPPIRDEPWDGDEKAKILVMNIYEMEVKRMGFFSSAVSICTCSSIQAASEISLSVPDVDIFRQAHELRQYFAISQSLQRSETIE